jgi:hypothetical protein
MIKSGDSVEQEKQIIYARLIALVEAALPLPGQNR